MSKYYIALEGIDGCGKSTIHKLLKKEMQDKYSNISFIREPGTTKFAEDIRNVVFSNFEDIKPISIQLAMLAARTDIRINEGITISDRCFLSSAYCEELQKENDIRKWLSFSFDYINKPNVILFFDISAQTSINRLSNRRDKNGYDTDYIPKITERIQSYKRWIHIVNDMCPEIKIITVDANKSIKEVLHETSKIITEHIQCNKNSEI